MGGGFAGCGVVIGVLPVGRKDGVAEEGRGFELVGVPVHERRSGGVVEDLLKLGARVVLVVVREEVGEGLELRAGGEELAVVRVDVADGEAPWAIGGLDVLQVGEGLVGGVGVVVKLGITVEVAVGALEVVPGGIGRAVPVESIRSGVAGAVRDGDVPLADVRRGVAGCLKQLAVGGICRIEDRHIGTGGYGGHEPALMCVKAGDDGAASRCAGAGRSVVVGEFHAALPDVFVEVGHEALQVLFRAVDPTGKDGGPTELVNEDEEDVGLRARFSCVFSETQAARHTSASDSGGRFQEFSALHCEFSNG